MGSDTKAIIVPECIKSYLLAEKPQEFPHTVINNSDMREELRAKLDDNVLTEDEFIDAANSVYKKYKGLATMDLHCVFRQMSGMSRAQGHKGSVDTKFEARGVVADLIGLNYFIMSPSKKNPCRRAKPKSK